VIRDQPHQPPIGPVLVTKESSPVQRVEPRHGQAGCVSDIVQCGGSDQQIGVLAKKVPDSNRTLSHSQRMRPPPWKHKAQLDFRYPRRPLRHQTGHAGLPAPKAPGPFRSRGQASCR
jgi:hypothetical protein